MPDTPYPYAPGGGLDFTGSSGWGNDFGTYPPDQLGFSVTQNPRGRQGLWDYIRAKMALAAQAANPISSAQANPMGLPPPGPPSTGRPLPPTAADSLSLAFGAPTGDDYQKWLSQQLMTQSQPAPSPAPSSAQMGWPNAGQPLQFPDRLPSTQEATAGSGYGGMPPSAWGDQNAPAPPKAVVHANAPKGSPAATPKPARAPVNKRFGTFQYEVPSPQGLGQAGRGPLSRNPIYTSLNLFGGRNA